MDIFLLENYGGRSNLPNLATGTQAQHSRFSFRTVDLLQNRVSIF